MSQSKRDALRAKILGEKIRSSVIQLDDGLTVEVRENTVGGMFDSLKGEVDGQPSDPKIRMLRMLIASCFVPETDEAIFEEGDLEMLTKMPTGGIYQKLIDAMNQFMPQKGLDTAKKP